MQGGLKMLIGATPMKAFFTHVQRHKRQITDSFGDPLSFCTVLASDICRAGLPDNIQDLLRNARPDDRDYAISSAYALLIGKERRKALSAYFTPPSLAHAVLEESAKFLEKIEDPTVLDPACGGGSFLTPIARRLITKRCRQGSAPDEACKSTLRGIKGIEIDAGLATLSQILLRKMLAREYGVVYRKPLRVVKHADALSISLSQKCDLVIGNPPYGKVGNRVEETILKAAGLANLGGHTNLYSLFLLRSLDWVKPGGGLVFVLPTSFVAGPYFTGLRQEVFSRAVVERIDLHEQRENLFLGAVQDICLLAVRRRENADGGARTASQSHSYELGLIDADGVRTRRGTGTARGGGEPWTLPVAHEVRVFSRQRAGSDIIEDRPFSLSDYGYRVRVGKVVPTRERERLHASREQDDLPLVWASAIRPNGSFDFQASEELGNAPWYSPPTLQGLGYSITKPAVVVQRTSNRDQRRRLNAALVPKRFRDQHTRGFVAENHVIVIETVANQPAVSPSLLVKILNSAITNKRFSSVSGTFSISAKLLQRLALPNPKLVRALDTKCFEHGLRELFDGLVEVLIPSEMSDAVCDTKDGVNKSRNLDSSLPIDQDTRLKRRAIT